MLGDVLGAQLAIVRATTLCQTRGDIDAEDSLGEVVAASFADMDLLAICGSLQAKSSNLTLLQRAIALAPDGVRITLFDGIRALPHFDPDLEARGVPAPVEAWRAALSRSDAVLIAFPEYGHSLPGALKNAIDWVIGSGELERKVVAITSATTHPDRGRLGLQALRQTLLAVSATIVGGEPIAKNAPTFDRDVTELVCALVEAARTKRD